MAICRHLQGYLLNRVSQLHPFDALLNRLEKPIVSGSAHLGRLAQSGYRLLFFADFLVDGPTPLSASCCSSKLRNSFFKKSISIACWPTLRSSSASRLSASI